MSPPIIELIGVLFVVVLLFFGEREIRLGRMNLAQFLAFHRSSVSQLRSDAQALASAKLHVAGAGRGAARLGSDGRACRDPEKPNAIELPPLRSEIEFRDVHFGYADEERSVLRDVSSTVPAGKMVALVGESGGGKSTLTKLLPRFHDPSSGRSLVGRHRSARREASPACAGRSLW